MLLDASGIKLIADIGMDLPFQGTEENNCNLSQCRGFEGRDLNQESPEHQKVLLGQFACFI
jgi:hypothetical protein